MGSFICLVMAVIVIVPFILIMNVQAQAQNKLAADRQAAYDSYQSALARLKADPTNRQATSTP